MAKRPGTGISPQYTEIVVGRKNSARFSGRYCSYMGYGLKKK